MTVAAKPKPKRKRKPRRRMGPPPELAIDPVTQYALDVREGRIVAGRAVRLAADRHVRDLEHQRTPEFPYYWDPEAAQKLIDFFPTFLQLENGEPFDLPPWLQFSYGSVFGWKRQSDGLRRYVVCYLESAKGSGKTPSAAGVGLYCLDFDDEYFAEVYSAAFDKGQAALILNDAIRMAEGSNDLAEMLEIGTYNIAALHSGGFFRATSSEHRSKSGPRPSCLLIDELHEHRSPTVVNKLRAGFKGRKQPLQFEFTNSGEDRTSICWNHHQKSLEVLEGRQADDQWFAYVCQLDPCEACYAEGFRQPKDGCKTCDDWTDPKVWPKANPALGIVIQPKYLHDQVEMAISMPSDRAMVMRLNFCIWTQTHQVWIPADRWNACAVPAVATDNAAGRPCAAGLDLSSKLDLSGFVVAIRYDDPPEAPAPETVIIDAMNAEGEHAPLEITLNFSIDLIPYAWIPEETLNERVRDERIPYDVWARLGKLFATPGGVIDHEAIYQFIVKNAWPTFKIQRLGYDERDATMFAVNLRDKAQLGDAIVAVGQGKKLSEAFKLIEVLVRARRLRHDGHPVLAWCIGNAEPKSDRLGARWIEKPSDTKRIDLGQAAAMAIHEVMLLPGYEESGATAFWL